MLTPIPSTPFTTNIFSKLFTKTAKRKCDKHSPCLTPKHHSKLSLHWLRYLGASVVNSFNKTEERETEAAVFSCRLCFLRAYPFISLLLYIDCIIFNILPLIPICTTFFHNFYELHNQMLC